MMVVLLPELTPVMTTEEVRGSDLKRSPRTRPHPQQHRRRRSLARGRYTRAAAAHQLSLDSLAHHRDRLRFPAMLEVHGSLLGAAELTAVVLAMWPHGLVVLIDLVAVAASLLAAVAELSSMIHRTVLKETVEREVETDEDTAGVRDDAGEETVELEDEADEAVAEEEEEDVDLLHLDQGLHCKDRRHT